MASTKRRHNLAVAHGFGSIHTNEPPGSHCNNIGAAHRKQIHAAFRNWFNIDVNPEDEYKNRRPKEDLLCLTDEARKEFQPKPLHEILANMADKSLADFRTASSRMRPENRRKATRALWRSVLGSVEPPKEPKVREGSPHKEVVNGIAITREILETEPGISVPLMTLSLTKLDGKQDRNRLLVLGVAADGIAGMLQRRSNDFDWALSFGCVVTLVDVRGTGASSPGNDHGQQSSATAHSATALMLGQPLLGGQLCDLRAAWRYARKRSDLTAEGGLVGGGTGRSPLAIDAEFSYPRRIEGRPAEAEPSAALLALLLGAIRRRCGRRSLPPRTRVVPLGAR